MKLYVCALGCCVYTNKYHGPHNINWLEIHRQYGENSIIDYDGPLEDLIGLYENSKFGLSFCEWLIKTNLIRKNPEYGRQ